MRVNVEARAASAELRRARTRERLLVAAEAVIAEKGVAAVSIATIVESAGVSRGVFYNYFPTTTDLLNELNTRVAASFRGRLLEIQQRDADPPTRLAASMHAILAAYLADPIRGWVALQVSTSLAPRQRLVEGLFETLFRAGVEAGHFHDVHPAAAITVCFGAMRMTQRDVIAGGAADHSVPVIALILSALGVPYDQAEQISRAEASLPRRG